MRVGVPKEIKTHEYRVGLTPSSVRELTARGHDVLIEHNAGIGISASDADYQRAGARIADSADAIYAQAELVVKVKEPQPAERTKLRRQQVLFTYLHLAPDPEQTRALVGSGATCIAYETVTSPEGGLPLLAPMSEVAGRMSVQAGARCLEREYGGMGILLGGVPGVPPARIAILGGGVVGFNAAQIAIGTGAQVALIDRSIEVLRRIDRLLGAREHFRGGCGDRCAGALRVAIRGADAESRIDFDDDLMAVPHQLAHAGRREPDAILVRLDFLRHADQHRGLPSIGARAPRVCGMRKRITAGLWVPRCPRRVRSRASRR